MRVASTLSTTPSRLATTRDAGVARDDALHAGADERRVVRMSGTAWRCMFEPMSARFASSCSRNGTSDGGDRHQLVRRRRPSASTVVGRDHHEVAVERVRTRA